MGIKITASKNVCSACGGCPKMIQYFLNVLL
nr:MAG TPA: oxidoreductase [Caudoviricetes sp.]